MKVGRTLRMSRKALFAHPLRTGLALAGVSMGVAGVLVTSAVGQGAERAVQERIQGLGSNLLVVRPAQVKKMVARKTISGVATTLRLDDAVDVAALSLVADTAPSVEAGTRVKGGGAAMKTKVVGTTPAYATVRNFRIQQGRFFAIDDNRRSARVVVLGARVADALFPGQDPVGQPLRIGSVPFDIIGTFDAKGIQADGDEDNQVVVPIHTALRRVFNRTALSTIYVSTVSEEAMPRAEREIAAVLRSDHRRSADSEKDDFEVQNAARMFSLQQQAGASLRMLTTGVAALAVVVGGAGILALMLMTVKERTAEIGLRMAVGATPRAILSQFLLEAAGLALAGWVGGLLLAVTAAAVMVFATTWRVALPGPMLLTSFVMALAIGVGFGAVPARSAARVPPVEALRSE